MDETLSALDLLAHQRLVTRVVAELRALSTTQDRLDQHAAQRFGLNRTDLRALDLIGQREQISPTALAGALGMSTGATSAVLDRLEAAGYALRTPHPRHRRRTLVAMAPRAQQLSAIIFEPVIQGVAEQAAAHTDTALGEVAEFIAGHRQALDRYLADTASPNDPTPPS